MKETWQTVKRYVFDVFGVILGFWTIYNWMDWSKINQILLTVYILMLIKYKWDEKHGKKGAESIFATIYRRIVRKDTTVKILSVSDKAEITVESLFKLNEKIRKEGKEDMKTLKRAFIAFGKILRANKFTLLGDGALLWVYYILLEDLFTTYGFSFANQPKSFYITFVVYTIGLIIALIGMNGKGLERVEQFLSRVNWGKLNGIVDELVGLSIETNAAFVEKQLIKAYDLLEKVQPFIQERQYEAIKKSLDNINNELKRYNALKILEKKRQEEELLQLAKQELEDAEQPQNSQNSGDRPRL